MSTFESVKNICGMPNNSKDPAFATKIRTATYENFSIINSHGGTQVESLQVFDPMYKDEYGVKVRDSRDSVYKVHDIAADQQCSATNKSFFCNSLKHVGLKRLEKKKISYYFSLDVVTIIEHW